MSSARIIQILPSLASGGAERVAINLANTWSSWGNQVALVLMEPRGELLDSVHPSISIHCLEYTRFRQVPVRLSRFISAFDPDLIYAHMWPLTSVALLSWLFAGKPGKLFLCEHTSLSDHVKHDLTIPLSIVKAITRFSHIRASGLRAVSKGAAFDLAAMAALRPDQVEVIYNPVVDLYSSCSSPCLDLENRIRLWRGSFRTYLLAVGSLKPSKNYRLLLESFAQLAEELDASLAILGEGPMRASLERDVSDLNLGGRVVLPGFISDPAIWYCCADLFVHSSNYEGFANVIAEALSCGVPVVSTDCPHGSAEILDYGLFGELVPVGDVDSLANGIRWALCKTWDRQALKRRSHDFSIVSQANAYLDLSKRGRSL